MNYHHTKPDLSPKKALTPSALALFQRFQQEADRHRLDRRAEEEISRHLKLCELAILKAAQAGFYWAELPSHPISGVNGDTRRHLEETGFKVEHREVGRRKKVRDEVDRSKEIEVVEIRSSWTASWLGARRSTEIAKEWERREALEDADRLKNPPQPRSTIADGRITTSDAVWADLIDKKYLAEVQRINGRAFLCVFDLAGHCRHTEETNLAYDAMFGPDIGDVQGWQDRVVSIVDGWKTA